MKKVIFSLLCVLIIGFTGCIKNGSNTSTIQGPAVVKYYMGQLMLRIDGVLFAIPNTDGALFVDDLIWAFFTVDYDNQASTDYYTVYDFSYMPIKSSYPIESYDEGGSSENYTAPIIDISGGAIVDHYLVLLLSQYSSEKMEYIYEMSYDPNEEGERPTVYIRAKKMSSGTDTDYKVDYPYAFNMYNYVMYQGENNKITINVKYKTGETDGKEQFATYVNPISFDFSTQ